MGSRGDCCDNAMCESFNATLECELLVKHRFRTQREAEAAVFDFIEAWYNPHLSLSRFPGHPNVAGEELAVECHGTRTSILY
jgi:transposase InsO family protein